MAQRARAAVAAALRSFSFRQFRNTLGDDAIFATGNEGLCYHLPRPGSKLPLWHSHACLHEPKGSNLGLWQSNAPASHRPGYMHSASRLKNVEVCRGTCVCLRARPALCCK